MILEFLPALSPRPDVRAEETLSDGVPVYPRREKEAFTASPGEDETAAVIMLGNLTFAELQSSIAAGLVCPDVQKKSCLISPKKTHTHTLS